MPGAGHLVHMPAHIYIRLGKYHEAAERNEQAAQVYEAYLAHRKLTGVYPDGYYTHNLHFLWASLIMEGRQADGMKTARQLSATISPEEAKKELWKEQYLALPIYSMIRFGQWESLLREPVPPKGLALLNSMWRLGRGLALAATGRLPGAEGELVVLSGLAKRLGRDRTPEQKTQRTLLKIAERLLAADIAVRKHRDPDAVKLFREAVGLEDGLAYTEPPYWPLPVRQYFGAALLIAQRAEEAEAVYRADLLRNRHNGWALFGLMQSLRAQGKIDEAETVESQFKSAWLHADVTLVASRF
jgi:hypothetical protein